LASIGIYGVTAYVAALRQRELGIRIALGADRARIRGLVLRQGAIPIAAGLFAGILIAALASRLATAFLRGVPPRDPLTYTAVAALLAGIALLATWIPALPGRERRSWGGPRSSRGGPPPAAHHGSTRSARCVKSRRLAVGVVGR